MHRRLFLKSAALSIPMVGVAGRLYALPAEGPRLLVVFLRGAYDAANIVVPVSSDFYYTSRPTLAIPRGAASPLNTDWGLHPVLKNSILPLWERGQVAFVPFAGTDDTSRSHFETQDTIELGQPVGGSRNYNSGFMSRLASVLSGSTPIAFTGTLPLAFHGVQPIPNIALNFAGKPGVQGKDAQLIEAMYQGQSLAPAVAEGFRIQDEVYRTISTEMQAANRNAVTPKGFELSAQRIGVLMRSQFNLGFVDVGGWDTHVNEGGVDGYLPNRIGELGRGLALLANTLGAEWRNTIVIVVSEFGRTARENGDRGTDHGHGSTYWILGGAIRGGQIVGEQVAVTQASLFQNRDWPVLNDYRAIIGGVLQKSHGMTPANLAAVFPGSRPRDLSLI
ncbi:MAG: DUF1501 domain-containing protein [Alphaproteobacteria bacterium]|nr:DUF1501 domain-containing protein [Reyranella sp.]MBL6852528.1 DUF1501 domain-containing protein [Alphaproteobacteria bacterium]MBL6940485.1 DUF1501 domain-containing protein [Alphaproteobacteria bacterium]